MVRNSAFLFIKPHALTDKVKELVKETLDKKGIVIKKEGQLDAAEIDKKELVDKHYYAIASKATLLTPDKLNVPADKFKDKFGLEWAEVLSDGKALNAKDACEKFEIDAAALDGMWAEAKKSGNIVKLGGGFYCAKLEPKDKGTFYVFNGFFMSMRSKFVAEDAAIYYYIVQWESESISWSDFRGKVLGPTDPSEAPADSLRGSILAKWKELDLKSEPNTGDNGVHASASPFEALAERLNWLGYRVERDPFGQLLLKAGVTRKQVKEWSLDPQVTFGILPITKSLFDMLEDTDTDYCLALCQMVSASSKPKVKADPLEAQVAKLKAAIETYKSLETAVTTIQAYVSPAPEEGKGSKKTTKGGKTGKAAAAVGEGEVTGKTSNRRNRKGGGKGRAQES